MPKPMGRKTGGSLACLRNFKISMMRLQESTENKIREIGGPDCADFVGL